jgi:hypothetical protein
MKKYTVLFCEDNKICFQDEGDVGIVNPMDILTNGRIIKTGNIREVANEDPLMPFKFYVHDQDVIFEPD